MENISAACAMDWSIELEKGLRSTKPGQLIESIYLIGPKLKQWSTDPQPTMAVYDMFGLIPGEDRLFADAILLRLADTFASGDKITKITVIRVFLSSLSHYNGKDGKAQGIFSNMGEENRVEFLRRVKLVLTSENGEFKALGLLLLGCCAEIAKDVVEMRYYILSTLSSSHVLEVKASLFAAGCFSEISVDFGFVCLGSLVNLMNSPKTLPSLRVVGARTFSKMGCSMLLAMKSYKAGVELVRKTLEEDLLATMLISLTKLSLKVIILICDQVSLLSSFLAQETSSHLQATALKCIRSLVEKATCVVPTSALPFMHLFKILDELKMPSDLGDEVLEILLKMVAYGLPDMLLNNFDLFTKLLKYVEDAIRSPIFSSRLLAFEILVCVSNKLKGRNDLMSEANFTTFPSGIVSIISDQIALLVRLLPNGASSYEVERELRSLLKLLLLLAKDHPELGFLMLDKIHFIIKNMENLPNEPLPAIHKVVIPDGNENFFIHEVMFYIFKFLVSFLETVDGGIDEIVCKFKELVLVVCNNGLFDCSTHTLFSLLFHSLVNSNLLPSDINDFTQGLNGSSCNLMESEEVIYNCSKNMLEGGDNWRAYKSGCYALCVGEWCVASFIFQHLEARVQSHINSQWLSFLVQFSRTEKNVKLAFQQVHNCPMGTISSEYIEKLVNNFSDLSSSSKVLDSLSLQTQTFCFQRWLFALRQKVLLVLVDILRLLNDCLVFEDGVPIVQKMKSMMLSLTGVSARLAIIVEEYDLISTSFIDLDSKSSKVISSLGFSCSLLSLCTEFTYFTVNSIIPDNLTKESGYQQSKIMKDFASRMWGLDSKMCSDLMYCLKEFQRCERDLPFQFGFRIPKYGILSKDILTLCRYSVGQLIKLQNECLNVTNEDTMCQIYKKNMKLLSNIVRAWMHIPFRVPKYFFRVRPTVGCLVTCISYSSRKQDETFVSKGSHLALNLCIQLKNVPSHLLSRISKIHCILSCRTSFLGTKCGGESHGGEGWIGCQASEIDSMIDLNKKLQCQVMKQTKEFINCGDHQSDSNLAETSVCFNTNGRAQGFSSCLLDVSSFPVGSYRIQWLCGGVDHQGTYWSFLPLNPCPQFSVIE